MQKPSTPPLVNRSALNRDGGSLREDKGCLDAQRARKPSSTVPTMTDEVDSGEKREISSCISETVMSFVAVLAPAPSESRVMEKVSEQLYSSTDFLQREDGSC